jgi:hypothetical protein
MEASYILAAAAIATFALSLGLLIFNGGWGLSGKLNKMESRLAQTVAETARDLEARQDALARQVGESIEGLRRQMTLSEKEAATEMHRISDAIRKVEIWARDEFVRKESFREVCARIETTVTENARSVNTAVQSLRDAILSIATGRKSLGPTGGMQQD